MPLVICRRRDLERFHGIFIAATLTYWGKDTHTQIKNEKEMIFDSSLSIASNKLLSHSAQNVHTYTQKGPHVHTHTYLYAYMCVCIQ